MRLHNKSPERSGAAAAELALLLPFLALMFFIALDYSRVFHCTQILQSSADVGAKFASGYYDPPSGGTQSASVALDDSELFSNELMSDSDNQTNTRDQLIQAAKDAAVKEGAGLNPPLKREQVHVSYANGKTTVVISYEFRTLTPFLDQSRSVSLERTVVMESAPHLTP